MLELSELDEFGRETICYRLLNQEHTIRSTKSILEITKAEHRVPNLQV
jgi:hypothetical protein